MIWADRPRDRAGDLAAVCAGSGPSVLLIHGVGLRAEAWAPQIDALARRFRVTAVDLPGHGHSPLRGARADLGDYTEAVATALSRPTVVIGHSMGAMIALDLAARRPEAVRAVGALNAVYRRPADAAEAVRARAAALDGQTAADPEPTLRRWFGAASGAERMACGKWLRATDPAGYRAAYRVFARADGPTDAALARMACPALFLTGAAEPNSTPAMSRAMATLSPRGHAQVVPGAAHMLPMTHPAETVAALLRLAGDGM